MRQWVETRSVTARSRIAFASDIDVSEPSFLASRSFAGQATGGITGKVVLGPRLSSRQVRFHLYPDAVAADTKHKPPAPANELRNVVIYVESAPSDAAPQPASPNPAIHQEDLGGEAPNSLLQRLGAVGSREASTQNDDAIHWNPRVG